MGRLGGKSRDPLLPSPPDHAAQPLQVVVERVGRLALFRLQASGQAAGDAGLSSSARRIDGMPAARFVLHAPCTAGRIPQLPAPCRLPPAPCTAGSCHQLSVSFCPLRSTCTHRGGGAVCEGAALGRALVLDVCELGHAGEEGGHLLGRRRGGGEGGGSGGEPSWQPACEQEGVERRQAAAARSGAGRRATERASSMHSVLPRDRRGLTLMGTPLPMVLCCAGRAAACCRWPLAAVACSTCDGAAAAGGGWGGRQLERACTLL